MDVTEFLESEYITADVVSNAKKKTAVILTAGTREETKFGQRFTIAVVIDGKVKKYQPRKDSLQALNDAWGKISDTWVNSVIEFSVKTEDGKSFVVARPLRKAREDERVF